MLVIYGQIHTITHYFFTTKTCLETARLLLLQMHILLFGDDKASLTCTGCLKQWVYEENNAQCVGQTPIFTKHGRKRHLSRLENKVTFIKKSKISYTISIIYIHIAAIVTIYRLQNDLYCVGWGVKLYSKQTIVTITDVENIWDQLLQGTQEKM